MLRQSALIETDVSRRVRFDMEANTNTYKKAQKKDRENPAIDRIEKTETTTFFLILQVDRFLRRSRRHREEEEEEESAQLRSLLLRPRRLVSVTCKRPDLEPRYPRSDIEVSGLGWQQSDPETGLVKGSYIQMNPHRHGVIY